MIDELRRFVREMPRAERDSWALTLFVASLMTSVGLIIYGLIIGTTRTKLPNAMWGNSWPELTWVLPHYVWLVPAAGLSLAGVLAPHVAGSLAVLGVCVASAALVVVGLVALDLVWLVFTIPVVAVMIGFGCEASKGNGRC